MTTTSYMSGRKKYARPQAIMFSEHEPLILDGVLIPYGYEVGAESDPEDEGYESFIILSDDNRGPININKERIENRKRMINGNMRSYHIADKLSITTSWSMLPSRSYRELALFDSDGQTAISGFNNGQYTSDGGAGGVEILRWYENHTGPFWVYLAYDKYSEFEDSDVNKYSRLGQYNQAVQVYISNFSYTIEKRGGSNHDFWNINIGLEEV